MRLSRTSQLTLPLPLVLWPLVFPLLPPSPFNFSAWPLLLPSQPSWPSLQAPLVCCLSAESVCPLVDPLVYAWPFALPALLAAMASSVYAAESPLAKTLNASRIGR